MNCDLRIMEEQGYLQALYGLSLSYNQSINKMKELSKILFKKDGGHNKFLESIQIWLDINMPRYWWQEFDTYRVGVTKQSESTMHTLFKKELTQNDFIESIYEDTLKNLNSNIIWYNEATTKEAKNYWFRQIKRNLPEGFLQKRVVCTNYKVLRNIIQQRNHHRLAEWQFFISYIQDNCKYKEFLV